MNIHLQFDKDYYLKLRKEQEEMIEKFYITMNMISEIILPEESFDFRNLDIEVFTKNKLNIEYHFEFFFGLFLSEIATKNSDTIMEKLSYEYKRSLRLNINSFKRNQIEDLKETVYKILDKIKFIQYKFDFCF